MGISISAIPAGLIIQRIKCKMSLTIVVTVSSILSILFPFAAQYNWKSAFAVRIMIGITFGFWQSSNHSMLSAWTHSNERSFLSALTYSGIQIGSISMLAVSGLIAVSPMGWPGIFYVSGCCGLLWVILICIYGSNSPSECLRISKSEKLYLKSNSNIQFIEIKKIPIRKILKSRPVWALLIAGFGATAAINFFLAEMPTYINNILGFNIQSVCYNIEIYLCIRLIINNLTFFIAEWIFVNNSIYYICKFIDDNWLYSR